MIVTKESIYVAGDIDHDGDIDIVGKNCAGAIVYAAPAGRFSDRWKRFLLPDNFDPLQAIDVDNDERVDIIGLRSDTLVWLEATLAMTDDWDWITNDTLPQGRSQGVVTAQVIVAYKKVSSLQKATILFVWRYRIQPIPGILSN